MNCHYQNHAFFYFPRKSRYNCCVMPSRHTTSFQYRYDVVSMKKRRRVSTGTNVSSWIFELLLPLYNTSMLKAWKIITDHSFKMYVKFTRINGISDALICTSASTCQRLRNVSFSKNLPYVLNGWPLMKQVFWFNILIIRINIHF